MIGPTSASTLRRLAANGAFSSCSLTMRPCASSICFVKAARSLACWRRICKLRSAALCTCVVPSRCLSCWSPVAITPLTAASICLMTVCALAMFSLSILIFSSSNATLAATSPVGTPWSMCALDKKPKIPMLVIIMSIATAIVKYVRIKPGARFQFCFSHIVATSLLTSSAIPIIIIGITLAAKIAIKPATE